MSDSQKKTEDPDEPAEFDPLNAPLPKLDAKQSRHMRRQAYMREYQRKNAHKRNTGRPPGRPPKPKQTEPARPKNYESIWSPQYRDDGTPGPQFALLSCPFPEIFFGGARGGGKTDGAIGKWLQHAHRYGPDAKGVFFRRRFKQLEEVQARCSALFPRIGATYHKGDANWVFPNGALLKLRHLWDVSATEEYQGHNYSWLCFEELTNWSTPDAIDRMRGTLRSAKGVPVELIMTGNPGGSGHSWVKQRYISPAPQGWTPIRDDETGAYRIYIPSRLEDNTAMMKNDPTYAARLRGTGSAALVNAWLKGDWDIVAGGFFDDLIVPDTHFLTPFHIPSTWSYRRSFDWGSASPASLGIWAVSDGNPVPDLDGFTFPRGSLIRIKEWYTVAKTKTGDIVPNEGLRLTNLALGEGIAQRALGYRFSGCVADPSIYSKLGRESIYDEMRKGAADAGHNLIMSPADNNRIGGWQKMRDMLENARADRPEKPGLWVFETCHHWLRTVPVMQRSDTDFDDVDTTQEDHPADDTRYVCMTGARQLKIGALVGR